MQKGITPIVAIILLLLITISITGTVFMFLQGTTETASKAGEEQLKQQAQLMSTIFRIDGVDRNSVIIRNMGSGELNASMLGFYVNNVKIDSVNPPSAISPGKIGTVMLNGSQLSSFTGMSDLLVTSGSFSDRTAAQFLQEQHMALSPGWRWFSFAIDPGTTAVKEVLASIDGKYDCIVGEYSNSSGCGIYQSYLTTLEPGKGYLIRMTQTGNLVIYGSRVPANTPLQLHAGNNFVGYLPKTSQNLPDVLNSINGKYSYVLGETGTYNPSFPQNSNLWQMEPGKSYFISMTEAAILAYSESG